MDDIEEIVYDEGAFDALVLDSEKKSLLRALVSNYKTSFKDIISGKVTSRVKLSMENWGE